MRMLENPSFKYAAAAPDEVAITETSDAPTAYRMSTLNSRVSIGTSTTPPPRPVSAPRNPAMNDPSPTRMVNSRMFIPPPEPVCHKAEHLDHRGELESGRSRNQSETQSSSGVRRDFIVIP